MKWFFPQLYPSMVETEVTQRDQFSNDDVGLSDTIIRESIQNSLDAADSEDGVKVSFRFLDANNLDKEFINSILSDQIIHARAAGLELEDIDFDNPTALIIEDYGTKGLTGAVNEKDKDNFSDFWRRHGKSHKTGKSRGRWGLGKLVFSSTSSLGVFFGATKRVGDPLVRLMGQTVLNLRTVNGKQYPPHAFYSDLEGEDDLRTEIPVPGKEITEVSLFCEKFSVKREEPGLSIIIPFPNKTFNIDSMIGVSIANYFYPLITNKLVLEFNDQVINSENVRELAHKYAKYHLNDIDMLFDFLEEVNSTTRFITLNNSWLDDNKLDENDFEEKTLEEIKKQYSNDKTIALKLPIILKSKDGTLISTEFRAFLKKPEDLSKGNDLYVRGGLTLPGEAKFKDRKALGAMIAEEEDICSFLGDAENAAHTLWIGNAEKVKKNYQTPQKYVKAIKLVLLQLYDLLNENIEEVDNNALNTFFWTEEKDTDKRKKRKRSPVIVPSIPKSNKPLFTVYQVKGGFTIQSTREVSEMEIPLKFSVRVAYDIPTGNPFKKYSPFDFKMGNTNNIQIDTNCKIESRKENKLILKAEEQPFHVIVRGFDQNRDLKLEVRKCKEL